MRKVVSGNIIFNGHDITNHSPKEIIDIGLGHIPEDRHARGVVLDFSVAENIALIEFEKKPFTQKGIYRPNEVRRVTDELQEKFDIRCACTDYAIRDLSGGNQQKVVLAREISREPKLLIAAQPSRGLDIGATEYTQKLLIKERTKGMAILLISTDLDEVLAVSDRVLILFEGEIMGEIIPGKATIQEIGLMMAGSKMNGEGGVGNGNQNN
jgi:simple sugar transport system ATP-binding protein